MPLYAYLGSGIVLYTLLITFSSRASGKIDPYWSSTIFGIASTVAPFLLWYVSKQSGKALLPTTTTGIMYSLAAGASAGIFTSFLVKIFEKGAVSYATPVIYGGTIAVTTMVGYFLFKETISGLQAAGIALTMLGIGIVIYSRMSGAAA